MIYVSISFVLGLAAMLLVARDSAQTLRALLEKEQARSAELLALLEARAAPAEYHALLTEDDGPDPALWVADDTGLLGYYEDPSEL